MGGMLCKDTRRKDMEIAENRWQTYIILEYIVNFLIYKWLDNMLKQQIIDL